VRRVASGAGAGFGIALAAAAPAVAEDFTVTDLSDAGPGSLRSAIGEAESQSGADRILFASGLSGTIALESDLEVSDPVQIVGPGPAVIAVDGGGDSGIFAIGSAEQGADRIAVDISGLTLRNGGQVPYGGAILSLNTDLTVTESILSGNTAAVGGAIYAAYQGSLEVGESTFSRNISGSGGGIAASGIDVTIRSSTFSQNRGQAAGGAIAAGNSYDPLSLDIENSTFNRNAAGYLGGAIMSLPDDDTESTLAIRSSTLSGNQAAAFGGAIGGGFSSATIDNSVIEGNFAIYGPDLYSGSFTGPGGPPGGPCGCYPQTDFLTGFSFIGDSAQAIITETVPGSNLLDQGDALLGRLADNGGPTQTMALSAESPVVNKGASPLTTDQRGEKRPVLYPGIPNSSAPGANGADMGAFELQYEEPPPPPPPPPKNGPFKILSSTPNPAKGTATVKVRVPAPGEVTLVGYKRLKTISKRANAKGVYKFRATPKGKLKRNLDKRGRARVLIKFHYNPDSGRTLDKGKVFPLFKDRNEPKATPLAVARKARAWLGSNPWGSR